MEATLRFFPVISKEVGTIRLTELAHIGQIKEQYLALRSGGCNREEATQQVVADALELPYEQQLTFWVGLADGQYFRKELSLEVASHGLMALNRISELLPGITPGDIERRRKHYTQAPMTPRKPGRPKKKPV